MSGKLPAQPLIAICFHCYYQNLLSDFARYLDIVLEAGFETDVYISYCDETPAIGQIRRHYPKAIMIQTHRGCDTGAFLLQLSAMYRSERPYDLIFKIHTKKNRIWRRQLLEPIAGSVKVVKGVVSDFQKEPRVGMIGAERWRFPNDKCNQPLIGHLCQRLKVNIKPDAHFIAGTIFWARYDIFRNWIDAGPIDLSHEYRLCEPGYQINHQPTYTHSWERIFGLIVGSAGSLIKGYHHPATVTLEDLPIDFDWQSYMWLNEDVRRIMVGVHEPNISQINKILYGVSDNQAVDVTTMILNHIKAKGDFNLASIQANDCFGDPYPDQKKKLLLFANNDPKARKVFDEYNGKLYPQLYKLTIDPKTNIINCGLLIDIQLIEKKVIDHYVKVGQFEHRPYNVNYFDWQHFLSRNPLLKAQQIHDHEGAINYYLKHASHRLGPPAEIHEKGRSLIDKYQIKFIAFYLPQYHAIPENDRVWGQGFTEWDLLNNWKPVFEGHRIKQPHPDIGNYNLINQETRRKQGEIAKTHGINAFCFYHYWFAGHKVMHKPAEIMILDDCPNIDFCFSWANEKWTRTWDGLSSDVLIDQVYGNQDNWVIHFNYLLPFFQHERYIKVRNCPMFLIYRCEHLGTEILKKMTACWNQLAKNAGFDGVFIVQTLASFIIDPLQQSQLDKIVSGVAEFHPGFVTKSNSSHVKDHSKYFGLSYPKASYNIKNLKRKHKVHFRGLFTGWDVSSRCLNMRKPWICNDAHPEDIAKLAQCQIENVIADPNPEGIDNFIFINAWNEWGEQAILEPNDITGYETLGLIKEVIDSYHNPP